MSDDSRKSRRFPPDEGAMAWIDPSAPDDRRDFKPTIPALVTDEALYGCGIVILFDDRLSENAECMVQVGNLAPLRAQIRWVKGLHNDVQKLGLMFLE
jgi:hypothetical protein